MRIALITPEFVTEHTFMGGLANYTYRAAKMLQDLGHDVTVITAGGCEERIIYDEIPVSRVKVRDKNGLKTPWQLQRIDRVLRYRYNMGLYLLWQSKQICNAVTQLHKERPFDILHYAHLGGTGVFRPPSIPTVVRLSSATWLCHRSGGYGPRDALIRQQVRLEQHVLKSADGIFGPSKHIAEHTSKEIGRPVEVIESPFLLETEQFDDSVYRTLEGKMYLLFFGSIGHIKGVATIAEMIHPLLERHPNLFFVFVGKHLVGQEGGPLLERVITNAREHSDRIIHFEPLRHKKLYPIVQGAHTVVLPSLIDNFPNTCIESMHFKKVVIGTKGNGFEQLIDHGRSGLLCNVGDASDLLQTIDVALLMTDQERREMGERAARRIEDLDPEKIGPQLVTLYERTIFTSKNNVAKA